MYSILCSRKRINPHNSKQYVFCKKPQLASPYLNHYLWVRVQILESLFLGASRLKGTGDIIQHITK